MCLCCFCPQGTSVLSPVLHIGSVIILAMMIYKKSAVQLFERHPCLYILAFGFVSAKITNKLVVSQIYIYERKVKHNAVVFELHQKKSNLWWASLKIFVNIAFPFKVSRSYNDKKCKLLSCLWCWLFVCLSTGSTYDKKWDASPRFSLPGTRTTVPESVFQ